MHPDDIAADANRLYDAAMVAKRDNDIDRYCDLMAQLDAVYVRIQEAHALICSRHQPGNKPHNHRRGVTTARVQERQRCIVALLEEHGKLATSDITRRTDYGRHAVYIALQKLRTAGVVECDGIHHWWLRDTA